MLEFESLDQKRSRSFFSQSIVPVAEADASVPMRHLEEKRLDQTSNVQRSCHLAPEFTSKDTAVWYLFNKRQQSSH